ncbi:glycoside hydrolase 100 family protein [Magnetofaba australis]|uniref:glycoside hydrolase 100 family protein n=1 Tax=Magnetofaba australis TaxID=1472297 RepID=UPI0039C96EF3
MAHKPSDAQIEEVVEQAYALIEDSLIYYQGKAVGCTAAVTDHVAAANYTECFIRDFFPVALILLMDGKSEVVRNFLHTVARLSAREKQFKGHEITPGVMPASFSVRIDEAGAESLSPDYGDRAIGRVAPVDSMMWWAILLDLYVQYTHDHGFTQRPSIQGALQHILHLSLNTTFEVAPTLLAPDGSFMIDRRMGVDGHPLEIQTLFYGMLCSAEKYLARTSHTAEVLLVAHQRRSALLTYLRIFFWLDVRRLNEIHRYPTEELGSGSVNMLNIYPASIPDWVEDWLPDYCGYFVGNLGPGRMDFRYFAQGNLLAILFGVSTQDQTRDILNLYEKRWSDLVGVSPAKIVYPAVDGLAWELITGSDPKNVAWSYHNGGNWPVLLWPLVAAALEGGREDLAWSAFSLACRRLQRDGWPEYYDGKTGRLIGRRSNFNQVWSAAAAILSHKMLVEERRIPFCLNV